MAKRKLKKLAKNIEKQPKFKKMIAEYLTLNAIFRKEYDLESMLLKGHRGFMAMSEKDLTDRFDKIYEELEIELKEANKEVEECQESPWAQDRLKEYANIKANKLSRANKIYDEIFEQVFL